MPTLAGGLRIDAENDDDWRHLGAITHDATSCDEKLAHRLGKLITDKDVAPDWMDYIVPDLEEGFNADLLYVTTAIASARLESIGGPGPLWISRDDAFHWYSSLNQARLAIEERHHFGDGDPIQPANPTPARRSAFLRSRFYDTLQSLLLDHVMR